MNISIEIVPRNHTHIQEEIRTIKTHLPRVNTINIPDIRRLDVRSLQGCQVVKSSYRHVIPHLRAIDYDLSQPDVLINELIDADVSSVLVVSGDAPASNRFAVYPNKSVDMMKVIRQALPHIKIYGAIDPYRQNFQEEYRYAMQKLDAGVAGFFTQPFFDYHLIQVYADLLPDTEVFWGVAPVLSQKSRTYWETVNRAIFPADFDLSLGWNRQFAEDVLNFAYRKNHHIYYMPIRVNLLDYLGGIL